MQVMAIILDNIARVVYYSVERSLVFIIYLHTPIFQQCKVYSIPMFTELTDPKEVVHEHFLFSRRLALQKHVYVLRVTWLEDESRNIKRCLDFQVNQINDCITRAKTKTLGFRTRLKNQETPKRKITRKEVWSWYSMTHDLLDIFRRRKFSRICDKPNTTMPSIPVDLCFFFLFIIPFQFTDWTTKLLR